MGLPLVVFSLGFGACADDEPTPPPVEIDAGPECNRGTENCACTTSGRCDEPLLCVAGRCLASGGEPDPPEPPLERPTLRPPRRDAGRELPDAAAAPDASEPADASAARDAGEAADALDGGAG